MTRDCPYKGLMPYGEDDARYFFGRERERRLISAALRASRLTVLYGESGAGKSSLLAAGVAHDLRDDPDYTLVLFRNWRDEATTGLMEAVRDSLSSQPGFTVHAGEPKPEDLGSLLQAGVRASGHSLLLVLDQFEEYFQYHPSDKGPGTLAEELPHLLNLPDLRANFLIALREDALSSLDRFKGTIPGLFDNLLRVEHLTAKGAEQAIINPLRRFKDELGMGRYSTGHNDLRAMEIKEEVANAVVTEIVAAQGSEQPLVQASYLQLVMTRWWEREISKGSSTMLLETLRELGGVGTIIERYLEDTLGTLSTEEKELAAEAFQYMVTPTGRKIAQTIAELAGRTYIAPGASPEGLQNLLGKLQNARVLSSVPPPRGSQPDERCYEFAHDVVAKSAFEWRKQFQHAQKLAEATRNEEQFRRRAQVERERAEEQSMQAKKFRLLASALGIMLLVALGAILFASWQRAVARARQMVATSILVESIDPELSMLIAAQGVAATWPLRHTVLPEVEQQLHRAIMASHVQLTFVGNNAAVYDVVWSPDGKWLASGAAAKTVKVWDAQTGKEVVALNGHHDSVVSVAWSPDGKRLATASRDKTAKVWDFETGKEILTLNGHHDFVYWVAWRPDGKQLATASIDKTVKVWDASTGKELLTLNGHRGWVYSVAWSPDGKHLVTGSSDGTAKVWNAGSAKELLNLNRHRDSVVSVAWSPDGKRLATGSTDKSAKLWDAETGKEVMTLNGHSDTVHSVAWSPDGKRLATGSTDKSAKLWDAETGTEIRVLNGHSDYVFSVAWSPDGKRLATGSRDKTAKVWDAQTGTELLTLRGHSDFVHSVTWSPDGKRLATGSLDKTAKVWDAGTGKEVLALNVNTGVLSVAWNPDSTHLATGNQDKTAKLWDANTGSELLTLRVNSDVFSVAWSPDGKRLATGSSERGVTVWDTVTGKEILTFYGNSNAHSVAWSPNGKLLATGSPDRTAKIWNAETGKQLLTLSGHSEFVDAVAWSPDGKRLATCSIDKTTKIWDVVTGKEMLSLKGHSDSVFGLAWSPDGKHVATGSRDRSVRVWDVQTGKEELALNGHSDPVTTLAWSPDGRRLATGSWDRTVQVYAMDTHDLVELVRRRITTRPSEEGCKQYLHMNNCPPVPELSVW